MLDKWQDYRSTYPYLVPFKIHIIVTSQAFLFISLFFVTLGFLSGTPKPELDFRTKP